jgi:predicted TIM-barrel fold metal-dependent hydrolase
MTKIIDVHHHWIPPEHAKDLKKVALPGQTVREIKPGTIGLFKGQSMLFWCNEQISSAERLIANLDRCGVQKAVISVSNWLEWLDLAMCREVNDAMHELKRRFPGRILTLAHVPIGEDGALEELERCRSMGVDGVFTIVHLSRKGWSLDHPGLNSFYDFVNRAALPVIVHPACEPLEYLDSDTPKERMPLSDHDLLTCYGRPYNTTVSLLRLLLSETLDKFPKLRFIYPHLGGSFGVMKQRILDRYYDRGLRETLERRLRHFWFDTAPPRWSKIEYRCAVDTLGADRIMLGSDHPIADDYIDRAVALLRSDCYSADEREKIGRLNAERFFSRAASA